LNHRTFMTAVLVAGISAAGVVPALAASQTYVGPGQLVQCQGADMTAGLVPPPGPNVRSGVNAPFQLGGCFVIPKGQATYDLAVKDASGTTPALNVNYQFADGSLIVDDKGNTVSPTYCGGSTAGAVLPKGAVYLNAFQLDPATARLDGCKVVTGVPTTGTITVTYHKPPPPKKRKH
jgi:hypothetical protein